MPRAAPVLQLVRFSAVGVANTLVTLASYALLLHARVPIAVAGGASYALGGVNGFALNRRFTFAHRGRLTRAALRYGAVAAVGAVLDAVLLHLLVRDASVPRALGELAAVPPVTVATFLACRAWAFAPEPDAPTAPRSARPAARRARGHRGVGGLRVGRGRARRLAHD
jgi:putative flippase GtrA